MIDKIKDSKTTTEQFNDNNNYGAGELATGTPNQANGSKSAAKQEAAQTLDSAEAQKDAVIAVGVALRAMAKDGKFAVKTGENEAVKIVNGAVSSAVNKTLSTLIIAIRNTVDSGLKSINAVLATVTQEDKSLEAITPADAATGGQKQ
ncbi:variable large family protein (plasmid) [Borrelia turicatae]|nr:variable large family protein [Borrelia turicatae]